MEQERVRAREVFPHVFHVKRAILHALLACLSAQEKTGWFISLIPSYFQRV